MVSHLRSSDSDAPPRHQLRSARYVSPTRGVFLEESAAEKLDELLKAIGLALPGDAVFTHLTAAALRGWRMPSIRSLPIIASTSADSAHLNRRGVYVRRCDVPEPHRASWQGVRVASPEWAVSELAEDLSLIDLVAVIDGVLFEKVSTIEKLRDAIVPGRRGAKNLRTALIHVDGASESWWESVLRMAHQLSDIPIRSQVEVFDPPGRLVGRADLHVVGTTRYPEYDGADHRDRERHQGDLRREKGFARLGLERYGYTSTELVEDPTSVIRDAEKALGWRYDPARPKRWLYELQRSSISRPGWIRLQRRLSRFDRRVAPRSKHQVAQ